MSETIFNIGDLVRTPYGEVSRIEQIRPDGEQRDGSWSDTPVYYVETQKPGSSRVWWYADQLEKVNSELTDKQKDELKALDRWYNYEQDNIRLQERELAQRYHEKLEALKAKHAQQVQP